MFSSTVLWVGLCLLLLIIVVVLYNTPRAKAARVRRADEYRRQEEERKEKERAEAARKARQMENFRKQRLVVYIREKDGRKSSFEAVLIRMLLKSGITVEMLPENNGHAVAGGDTSLLMDGLLALVGTSWVKTVKGGGYTDYDIGAEAAVYIPSYTEEITYCDYRLVAGADEGKGKLLGAGCSNRRASYEEYLANSIIVDLASTLPETQKNK